MQADAARNGRLIALDGIHGASLRTAGKQLLRNAAEGHKAGGVSEWNASNIFFELQQADPSLAKPSPRVLMLLYAADLVFRLRWEILPLLEEGRCVVAAPYVETAFALGKAAHVSKRWLVELLRFAPKPQACYRIHEDREPTSWIGKPQVGFVDYACNLLAEHSPDFHQGMLRDRVVDYLHALARRKGCQTVPNAAAGSIRK